MKKHLLIASIAFGSFAVSCSKSTNSSPKVCSLNATNLVGIYQVSDATYKYTASIGGFPVTYGPTDIYSDTTFFPACRKDDMVNFLANDSVTYIDAGKTCSTSLKLSGLWSISGDSITIPIPSSGGSSLRSGRVSNFSCTGMTVTIDSVQTANDELVLTYIKVS